MESILNLDAKWLFVEIIAWALYKILFEVAIRLGNYNSDKHIPGLIILTALLYLLTAAAALVSPLMCLFDFAVDNFKINRVCDDVAAETREETKKLYHIPPYDKPRF